MAPKRKPNNRKGNDDRGQGDNRRGGSYRRDDSRDYLRDLVDKEKKRPQRAEEKKKQRREDRRMKKLFGLVARKHRKSGSDSGSSSSSSRSSSSSFSSNNNSSSGKRTRKAVKVVKRKAKKQAAKQAAEHEQQIAKLRDEVEQLKAMSRAGQSSADRNAAALEQQKQLMQGLAESVMKQNVHDRLEPVQAAKAAKGKGKGKTAKPAVEPGKPNSSSDSDFDGACVESGPSPPPPAAKKQRKQCTQQQATVAPDLSDMLNSMILGMLGRIQQFEQQVGAAPSSHRGPSTAQ